MFSILDETELLLFLEKAGEKKYRATQIYQAIFKDFVESIDEITTIPETLRDVLKKEFFFSGLSPVSVEKSKKDDTSKALFETRDHLFIESVLMRHLTGRITACISSQVGCPLKCAFCATGKLGFYRNLYFYEMLDQVLFFERMLKKEQLSLRNIVFMGMGEPLLNYDQVWQSIRIMNDPKKLEKGARHITISTCGIIPAIEKLIAENVQIKLAISLHAPNDEIRDQLMPINTKYPLKELFRILDLYTEKTNKRIFYEYLMLKNINDQEKHGHLLGQLLRGKLAHVNLIPWNSVEKTSFQPTERAHIQRFQKILETYGIPSTIRVSLGDDISAACGQLAQKKGISVPHIE